MTIDRRLLAGALGLTLVLAACGGTSTASSGAGTASPAPASPAPATPAPATPAAATEAPTDDSGPDGQVNGLASMLPEKVGDIPFERVGYDGDQIGTLGAAAGLSGETLNPILEANGKTIADVNFAVGTSTSSAKPGTIFAIQIEGVPSISFAGELSTDLSSLPKTTIGGKTVYGQATGGFGFFAYPKDDILFMILLTDAETAASIIEQLP